MDVFLGKVTQQAMNYAIRSGITITAGYAIRQSSRLLKTVEGNDRDELQDLQERLDSKIKIISPAIDMIELLSARGNTSLESAVSLTKSLRWEIQSLGQRLASAASTEERMCKGNGSIQDRTRHDNELKRIMAAIKRLLVRIEDAVPLINLAITASGVNLSSAMPSSVSPSRLLQASTFLTAGDSQYSSTDIAAVQIGPTFTLSMYMLFEGHLRPESEEQIRQNTWKEIIHKANVRLIRVSLDKLYDLPTYSVNSGHNETTTDHSPCRDRALNAELRAEEFAYQMVIVEDLDDDRIHTFEENEPQPESYGEVAQAGIREALPIHQLSKIFYADTGKILNIGNDSESNSPVLLLKRDVNAAPPRRMIDEREDAHSPSASDDHGIENSSSEIDRPWSIPDNLDPEWIAFEVYTTPAEDSENETETDADSGGAQDSVRRRSKSLTNALSRLQCIEPRSTTSILPGSARHTPQSARHVDLAAESNTPSKITLDVDINQASTYQSLPRITTSLSLLEMLLRLLSLQQFQQTPHLSIPDELLNFFLSESVSTTGAASHEVDHRKRLRDDARRRVGFDPYDESPVKRRGEDYQYQAQRDDAVDSAWEGEYGSGAAHRTSPASDRHFMHQNPHRGYADHDARGSRASSMASPIGHSSADEGYGTYNLGSIPSFRQGTSSKHDLRGHSGTNSRILRSNTASPSLTPSPAHRLQPQAQGSHSSPHNPRLRSSHLSQSSLPIANDSLSSPQSANSPLSSPKQKFPSSSDGQKPITDQQDSPSHSKRERIKNSTPAQSSLGTAEHLRKSPISSEA